jgi:signal transduction histidine kinase
MASPALAQRLPFAVAALLLVLLALLATLQWHWSGEVSALERERMRSSLSHAATSFTNDVDREVTRAFFFFRPEPGQTVDAGSDQIERVLRQYGRWQAEAPYPGLIRDVFLIRPPSASGGTGIEVLRPAERRFEPCPWPAGLEEALQERPRQSRGQSRGQSRARGAFGTMVAGDLPGLVIPLSFPRPPEPGQPEDLSESPRLVLRFDREMIAGEMFPALTRRYFQTPQGNDYALAVVDEENPGRIVYLSDPQVPAASFRTGDLSLGVLGVRPFEELRPLWEERRGEDGPRRWRPWESGREGPPRPRGPGGPPPGERPHDSEAWRLVVKHRDGSLEEAVAAIRRRNLGISLGILALLAATAGLLMVTTQRAQRLARQQIEFVAGVTHELHTPLTAIRSAGQNLADGVVADPTQVRRYGNLIEGEGRRLSNMVGQALEFAGIQSGRRVYHPQPVEPGEVVDGALKDCRWLLQEKRVEVEKDVEPGLPPVLADASALRHAVANLVENAVKYGGRARWIGLRVRREPSGQVGITVSDRGAGIRKEDLPHLFKPFFRSREAATGGIPGTGLGLSLVRHIAEAHGGRVQVVSEMGKGSAFTILLPAAAPEAGGQSVENRAVEDPA